MAMEILQRQDDCDAPHGAAVDVVAGDLVRVREGVGA